MPSKSLVHVCAALIGLIILTRSSFGVIRVYEDINYGGTSRLIPPFKQCLNLNNAWAKRISSVNTEGGCIILCDRPQCRGNCEKIFPGTPGHLDFTLIDFNDKATSYRNCESPNSNNIPAM